MMKTPLSAAGYVMNWKTEIGSEVHLPHPTTRAFQDRDRTQLTRNRRTNKRYALDLVVTYRTLKGWPVTTGSGRTINMSSSGIAFSTADHLNIGTAIELSIGWPVLLNQNCLLKLVIEGHVVRSSNDSAAIIFKRHQFRTQGQFARAAS